MNKPIVWRKIKTVLAYAFLAWLISFFIMEGAIYLGGKEDEPQNPDYIIVLGAGLRGKTPSLTLLDRLRKCLEYANENEEVVIIVTGGQGKGEDITEASAMKKYLVDRGIDESRIVKEEKSTSTVENIKFAKKIMEDMDGKSVHSAVIISNRFHLLRAKAIAREFKIIPYGMPSATRVYLAPKYYVREYFAMLKLAIEMRQGL